MSKNYIQHYGIEGMKKGIRRWQNYDGTFNEEGKKRYFGKSGERSRLESKISYMQDMGYHYTMPKGIVQWLLTGGVLPTLIVASIYSKKINDTKMNDLVQKGNILTDDLLSKYGDMTYKEAYKDIFNKLKDERKLPKDQRIRYADTVVNI